MFKHLFIPLAVAGLIVSGQALAHATLQHTTPEKGATVTAPSALALTFDDPVKLTSVKLSHDGKETSLDVSKAQTSLSVSVPAPTLPPGLYTVRWSALSEEDGHAMTGTFSFTVSGK